jgi:hypothetical protein
MKKLLLAALLCVWTVALTRAQEWAGGLPVDSTSGRLVYRGRVEAKGVSVTTLRQRAKAYTFHLYVPDTTRVLTETLYHVGGRPDLDCQLVIRVASGSYRYELSKFHYFVRGGEGFGRGGRIEHISPNYSSPVEEMLRGTSKHPTTTVKALQEEIAQAAAKAIAELQAAMQ